jgi:hypothetical protein
MKTLLGALMCLVLTTVQSLAVAGGPVFPAGTNITGTYAGVLEPQFDPTDPFSSNSLGIFSLGVPATGLSTGTFVMFFQGTVFRGSIQGVGSPLDGTLKAVLSATFSITNTSTLSDIFGVFLTGTTTSISARAEGSLKASVKTRTAGIGSATLLKGTANLFVSRVASATGTPTPGASPSPTPASGGGGTAGGGAISAAFSLDLIGFKQSNTAVLGGAPTGTGGGTGGG